MPLYLEARDLVTILAKRECSSVFSPAMGVEKEKEGCQEGLLSLTVLWGLIYSSFHSTQLSSFSTMTDAVT